MTNTVEAVMIDTREPGWVQKLKFGGVPASVIALEAGDVHVVCNDGAILMIERKTPEDFLNSLREERLFPQLARLAQPRIDEQIGGQKMSSWPYMVVCGEFNRGPNGKVVTPERGITNWDYSSVQGALTTIQEMGVMVISCGGDLDFEACILRLAERKRDDLFLLPPRPPSIIGAGANFLASLPGIGIERVMSLMEWGGNCPAHILSALTDLEVAVPGIGRATRLKIRGMLGLRDGETLASPYFNQHDQEVLHLQKTT